MVCCFFGHRDTPPHIKSKLMKVLIDLIENKGANKFYVGHQGNFDRIVCGILQELKQSHPHICCNVVLAYLNTITTEYKFDFDTVYPEGLECVPPRFAISARNKWMIENSDYVVTYVTRPFGGAAQFKDYAQKKGKIVINIS